VPKEPKAKKEKVTKEAKEAKELTKPTRRSTRIKDLPSKPDPTSLAPVWRTATDKLFGVAESLWEPDLVRYFLSSRKGTAEYQEGKAPPHPIGGSFRVNVLTGRHSDFQDPEDLFETISQTLMNAVDWDVFSGWGAIVHVM